MRIKWHIQPDPEVKEEDHEDYSGEEYTEPTIGYWRDDDNYFEHFDDGTDY